MASRPSKHQQQQFLEAQAALYGRRLHLERCYAHVGELPVERVCGVCFETHEAPPSLCRRCSTYVHAECGRLNQPISQNKVGFVCLDCIGGVH